MSGEREAESGERGAMSNEQWAQESIKSNKKECHPEVLRAHPLLTQGPPIPSLRACLRLQGTDVTKQSLQRLPGPRAEIASYLAMTEGWGQRLLRTSQ
jgi:hypothetical protein